MRVDKEKDGKMELDYGKEELNKDPNKGAKKGTISTPASEMVEEHEKLVDVLESKSRKDDKKEAKKQKKELKEYKEKVKKSWLAERWDLLKGKLSNDEAFMNMAAEDGFADAEAAEQQQDQEQPQEQDQEQPQEAAPMEDGQHPDLAQSGADIEDEQQDASVDQEQPQEDQGEEELTEDEKHSKVAQMLAEEGYSDSEIAHIIHGYSPMDYDPSNDLKTADAQQKMQQKDQIHQSDYAHKQRMQDLEYEQAKGKDSGEEDRKMELEHKQRMNDLAYEKAKQDDYDSQDKAMEREHRKRMLDLEYEKAKLESQLETEYKQKELEAKIKLLEQGHAHKMKLAEDKAKHQAAEQKVSLKEKSKEKAAEREIDTKEKK